MSFPSRSLPRTSLFPSLPAPSSNNDNDTATEMSWERLRPPVYAPGEREKMQAFAERLQSLPPVK